MTPLLIDMTGYPWMMPVADDPWQQFSHCIYYLLYTTVPCCTLLQHALVLAVVDCQFDSNMLKIQHSAAFYRFMQWQIHTVDNISQNMLGYAGRKQSLQFSHWWPAFKIVSIENKSKIKITYLKVVVCVLLCIFVCLFGAASLSFCLLLFGPSPHFSGLLSYCCPNNPSSRKKRRKRGSRGGGGGGRCGVGGDV